VTRSYIYLHAKTGRRDELVNVLDRLEFLTAARKQAGFLAAEVQAPFDDQNHLLVCSSWASREHYERWLASPPYQEMLREIAELVDASPELRLYHIVGAVQ
jgi:quinol monooxygenase YgiN